MYIKSRVLGKEFVLSDLLLIASQEGELDATPMEDGSWSFYINNVKMIADKDDPKKLAVGAKAEVTFEVIEYREIGDNLVKVTKVEIFR